MFSFVMIARVLALLVNRYIIMDLTDEEVAVRKKVLFKIIGLEQSNVKFLGRNVLRNSYVEHWVKIYIDPSDYQHVMQLAKGEIGGKPKAIKYLKKKYGPVLSAIDENISPLVFFKTGLERLLEEVRKHRMT